MTNPLAGLRLETRAEVQDAVRALCAPAAARTSPGGARVRFGDTAAHYGRAAAELEGFSRLLWGLVPLAAGGGDHDGWARVRQGLTHGPDAAHPEYWGDVTSRDQRMVEMAALGFALSLVPELVWTPLDPHARQRLAAWLFEINRHEIIDNNWLFFRVLVNLGLANVGAEHDEAAMHRALDRLESFHLGDGWYEDGPTTRRDYYVPWAFHFYGLIYARLAGESDPERAERFRGRAAVFARDFVHWFGADGAAVPYGRSLTYRFAQGGFWGALAFAGVEALPWGVVKGLALRNLRWWARRPIFQPDGTLSIGYGYPNLVMAESYNAPGSPYWAMKTFLPLALPAGHPFWQADEEPLPDLSGVHAAPHAGIVTYRDRPDAHVVALSHGQPAPGLRHGPEKYGKFAYSTAFGFSVPVGGRGLQQLAPDSMLALADDGVHYRVREEPVAVGLDGDVPHSRWQPWPDVDIDTWLLPHPPWHLRIHRLRTGRRLHSAEGGFAVDRDELTADSADRRQGAGAAWARGPAGTSGITDPTGERAGRVLDPEPGTNLIMPLTALPLLLGEHEPGEHWLACAVLADTDAEAWSLAWDAGPPALPSWFGQR
ncbi:DUF2264 domain-containing protein [Jiangella endophytica]|uniref:DUF2264 domain-containing protein n=1 Tax=Jiangella endophytica TaxID=1623398 RepID=UPI0018E551FE|nr:DUF2264 domain-containing protein [Jiangella endophytica]